MVSTRGVKFKFSEGEKVLCYEPDPTKAKVLYESKVLELSVNRDSRGRKVPEYLIHFFGWSSNWDRLVKEEFILMDNEENRILQKKLSSDAAVSMKGKRIVKLPPIIKESLSKQDNQENDKDPPKLVETQAPESSSSSDMSDSEDEKNVEIEIPSALKEVLEKDWSLITLKDKVFKLPCEKNVVSLLESFIRHTSFKLESALDTKDAKTEKEITAKDIADKLHFCKEVMDGLRVYFDFTLPHLLLYRQEKKQFYTTGNTCLPVYKSHGKSSQKNGSVIITSNSLSNNIKEEPQSNSPTRGGLRNQLARQKSPSSQDEEMNDGSRSKGLDRVRQRVKRVKLLSPRRRLRSSDKPKATMDDAIGKSDGLTAETSGHESDQSGRVDSPPTSPSRLTRSSAHNACPSSNSVIIKSSPAGRRTTNQANVSVNASTNHVSSSPPSQKSTPPTVSSSVLPLEEPWRLLPQCFYTQVPAAPSLIYGGQHLLRLFVKLPELIYKTSISQKKLVSLLEVIHEFLEYLDEKKDEMFFITYIDSGEGNIDGNSVSN